MFVQSHRLQETAEPTSLRTISTPKQPPANPSIIPAAKEMAIDLKAWNCANANAVNTEKLVSTQISMFSLFFFLKFYFFEQNSFKHFANLKRHLQ